MTYPTAASYPSRAIRITATRRRPGKTLAELAWAPSARMLSVLTLVNAPFMTLRLALAAIHFVS